MLLDRIGSHRKNILPTPDVLHDRSKIGSMIVEVEPDVHVRLHRFESDVSELREIPGRQRDIKDILGRHVGTRYWNDVVTTDGVDRGVTTYVPDEAYLSGYPFSLVMDTAWFTGLEGHNDMIAETFMKELGVSVVVVGPEFSSADPKTIGAETKLGRLAAMSAGFSLMRSGEASANIYSQLLSDRPDYRLENSIIGAGESRAAMIEQIRRFYMTLNGVSTLHSDITDPNVSQQALRSFEDVVNLLRWPVREAMGSLAVGAALLKRGDLHREIGTVPINQRYLVGATIGMGPALLSGEEGTFADFTPKSHPQHVVNFNRNSMAHTDLRRERYAEHFNTTIIELNGCHLGLGFPSVQRYVIDRTHAIGKSDFGAIDWRVIHGQGRTPLEVVPAA